MSILDKVAAAITPLESADDRRQAKELARSMAGKDDWLGQVLDQHEEIERLFDRVRDATDTAGRESGLKALATVLTGHSIAEEVVLYPAMVKVGEQGSATMAYAQQQTAKTEIALLEDLDPHSQAFLDKLEHVRGAVLTHVYEEEGKWYPYLKQHGLEGDQAKLTSKFREQYERYMGGGEQGIMFSDDRSFAEREGRGEITQQRDFAAHMQADGAADPATTGSTRDNPVNS